MSSNVPDRIIPILKGGHTHPMVDYVDLPGEPVNALAQALLPHSTPNAAVLPFSGVNIPSFSIYTPGTWWCKCITLVFFAVLYLISLYVSHKMVFDEETWGKYGGYIASYGLTFLVTIGYLLVTYGQFISWPLFGMVFLQAFALTFLSVFAESLFGKYVGVNDVTDSKEIEKVGFISSVKMGIVVAVFDVMIMFFICNRITFSPLIKHPQALMLYGLLSASVIALVQGIVQSCRNVYLPPIFHPDRDERALPVTLGVLSTPVLLFIGWLIGAGFARERFLLYGRGYSFLMKLTGTLMTIVAPLVIRSAANLGVQIMYRWDKWFGPGGTLQGGVSH